jgi:hypothetical protein
MLLLQQARSSAPAADQATSDVFCWQAVLLLAELMLAIGEHGEQSTDVTILACALHDIKA